MKPETPNQKKEPNDIQSLEDVRNLKPRAEALGVFM